MATFKRHGSGYRGHTLYQGPRAYKRRVGLKRTGSTAPRVRRGVHQVLGPRARETGYSGGRYRGSRIVRSLSGTMSRRTRSSIRRGR